ncbi:MAG: hypothetical protein [Psittacine adenovirus 12]
MIVLCWLLACGAVAGWGALLRLYNRDEEREKEILVESLAALMNALSNVTVQLDHAERPDSSAPSSAGPGSRRD